MDIQLTQEPLAELDADWLIAGVFENADLDAQVRALDESLDGQIKQLRERGDLTGKLGDVLIDPHVTQIAARRLCLVGLGRAETFNSASLYRAVSTGALAASKKKGTSVACALPHLDNAPAPAAMAQTAVTALLVGSVGPGVYRAEPQRHPFASITIAAPPTNNDAAFQTAIDRGRITGEAMNLARDLVNRAAADVYPETFAARAQQLATEFGLKCEIFDQPRLEAERMGSMLAVARGSDRPPRMVVLQHQGGGKARPTIALVGKGVTFDSGGLSIKPSDGMKTMKCDMAGAATVLAVMTAIARLKLPVNVIGLMGLVENMVSGSSYKLGDVLTARNGVTIEVLNTDAEGRLVLADVLSYAVDQGVDRMIDLATLTGSCVVALGEDIVGVFANNDDWCSQVIAATKSAGEPAWPMPMDDMFNEQLISDVADCKNVGKRWGGAITAAKFLQKFVGDVPWVHLDIAGPAFAESGTAFRESGATGAMVRSLIELLSTSSSKT